MFKQSRCFVSAALVAAVLISALILSSPNRVKACPVPIPATLLELFLRSDLIVVADIKNAQDGAKIVAEKSYDVVEINRHLSVSSVLKGKSPKNIVFTQTEYRDKESAENDEDAAESETEYVPFGYRGFSKLAIGERYLFFLTKADETGRFELSDEVSSAKKLDNFELGVHRKRLAEIKKIVETKNVHPSAITDWLVRLVEEPSTRWDGVMSLTQSFNAAAYKENVEDAAEKEQEEPFVIDENFNSETPLLAENLSDWQKNYISSVYFSSMPADFNENDESFYFLKELVARWDKFRMLTHAYGALQTVDETDAEKTGRVMNYISSIVDDARLREIVERYEQAETENASKEPEGRAKENVEDNAAIEKPTSAEIKTEIAAMNETAIGETAASEAGINKIAIVETASNETTIDKAAIDKASVSETIEKSESSDAAPTMASEASKKISAAQARGNARKDFVSRYEYLLARNFAPEEENEQKDEGTEQIARK